jgi:hypothetical protein
MPRRLMPLIKTPREGMRNFLFMDLNRPVGARAPMDRLVSNRKLRILTPLQWSLLGFLAKPVSAACDLM